MESLIRERPLYVEFVGLPGAGKTTVLCEVLPRLTALGYRCVFAGRTGARVVQLDSEDGRVSARTPRLESTRSKVLLYLSLHFRLFWRLTRAAYLYVFTVGKFEKKRIRMARALLRTVGNIRAACGMVRADQGDLIISSQGVAAYLRQMIVTNGSMADEELVRVARRLQEAMVPTRVVLVVFDVDAATAAARVQQRPRQLGPWDRMELAQRRQVLSTQLHRIDRLLVSLSEAQVVHRVLRIDATKAPAESAEVIADFLVDQLAAPRVSDLPITDAKQR